MSVGFALECVPTEQSGSWLSFLAHLVPCRIVPTSNMPATEGKVITPLSGCGVVKFWGLLFSFAVALDI